MSSEAGGKRKFAIVGAVAFAVLASVAAIGVPAGWYSRAKASAVASPQATTAAATIEPTAPVTSAPANEPASSSEVPQASDHGDEAAQALKRQREKEKEKARKEKPATAQTLSASGTSAPAASDSAKGGPKKITVTVTYDESGRVTQASGGDASAVRIARPKRFPGGESRDA